MKILFLSAADNYHTKKWCSYFISKGHQVHVISLTEGNIDGAVVHYLDCGVKTSDCDLKKLKYLTVVKKVKKIICEIDPDIVNAHYASSYGMIAALSNINRYVLSVWGADIYDFPQKSLLHKLYIKYVLKKASFIFSTSNAMASEINKYTNKKIYITPFGVKTDIFSPDKRSRKNDGKLVIGTIKALTPKYGIDVLLKAIKILRDNTDFNINLRIAGKGDYEFEYKQLAKDLKISDITDWLGFISQEDVAKEWANMDIAIIPSTLNSESFGVSAVEAEACGVPVIISDIPGLMEATNPSISSLVVKRKDPKELANAIEKLANNPNLMKQMGKKGREFVIKKYSYDICFKHIENLFIKIVNGKLR